MDDDNVPKNGLLGFHLVRSVCLILWWKPFQKNGQLLNWNLFLVFKMRFKISLGIWKRCLYYSYIIILYLHIMTCHGLLFIFCHYSVKNMKFPTPSYISCFFGGTSDQGTHAFLRCKAWNSTSCYNLRARRIRSLGSAVAGWYRFLVLLRAEVEWKGWNDIMQH